MQNISSGDAMSEERSGSISRTITRDSLSAFMQKLNIIRRK